MPTQIKPSIESPDSANFRCGTKNFENANLVMLACGTAHKKADLRYMSEVGSELTISQVAYHSPSVSPPLMDPSPTQVA